MLLRSIKLVNFRQFYGECELHFAADSHKNITLVHGENGVGKTTLLNAILWCLFEHLTPDFERPKELLNFEARNEGTNTCRVELEFEHEGARYMVQRHLLKDGESRLKVHKIEHHNFREVPAASAFINSVLPRDMAPYFFFHGEGIASINEAKGGEKFRKAIRDILGFTFAETAIEDLHKIRLRQNRDLVALGQQKKVFEAAASDRAEAEEALENIEARLKELVGAIADERARVADLEDQLGSSGNVDAARLRDDIASCERRLEAASKGLRDVNVERQALIAKFGWAVFGAELMHRGLEFIDEKTLKGKIPAPYQESFVQDLLALEQCICGTPLKPGSAETDRVMSLLESASTAMLQQRVMKARSIAANMEGRVQEFMAETEALERRRRAYDSAIGKEEPHLKDLEAQLDGIDQKRIKEITASRKAAIERRDALLNEKGRLEERKSVQEALIQKAKQRLATQTGSNLQQQRLMKVQDFVEAMTKRCKSKLESYESSARITIAEIVNGILQSFSRKDYEVRVTESFEFHLVRSDGGIVAKSKGERLLLNLAFVAALIELAKRRQDATGRFLVQGTVAPFVVDAPFGELDETYKATTSTFLPTKVPQLVLLLSSAHWKGTVDSSIKDRIGAEYLLVSHRRVEQGSKPSDEISIRNRAYRQSRYSASRDLTTIERI